jgi:hypothetical protein
MNASTLTAIAVVSIVSFVVVPSHAASLSVGFSALGSTTVVIGQSLDFVVTFGWQPNNYGPINWGSTTPPAPNGGLDYWVLSGGTETRESLGLVNFEVTGGSGYSSSVYSPSGPEHLKLAFDRIGNFDVTLAGNWEGRYSYYGFEQYATRECYFYDDGAACTSWVFGYRGGADDTRLSGGFGPITLQVQVVPEPASTALLLLGLVAVGALVRRRHAEVV